MIPQHLSSAPGQVTHCPDGVVGPLPPPQTQAGFVTVRRLPETFWAAFTPPHSPDKWRDRHLRATHSWFPAPWSLPFQPLLFPRCWHRPREGKRLACSHTAGCSQVPGAAMAQPVLRSGEWKALPSALPRAFAPAFISFFGAGKEGGRLGPAECCARLQSLGGHPSSCSPTPPPPPPH